MIPSVSIRRATRDNGDVSASIEHRRIEANGIRMHIAEIGSGPLVVLLHGFPELWYSWRRQLVALAAAGYRAVAPDQRGYGQTDQPAEIEAYSMPHLVGDLIGLLDALGEERAVVVGHDWGAPVAWNAALWRPDRVRGVVGLSVPFRPRGPRSPLARFRANPDGPQFYQLYFQEPGVAEADLQRDVRASIRLILYAASGDCPVIPSMMVPRGERFLGAARAPDRLADWLSEADIDTYTAEFERTGFSGGLNWYRNIDRNWELAAPWQGARIEVPALFMVGDRDVVYHFPGSQELIANLASYVPRLRQTPVLEGCGHWTQQERPAEVNSALLEFLSSCAD
jgi:pimeloyl-ACP methyl ester carboxylesterase